MPIWSRDPKIRRSDCSQTHFSPVYFRKESEPYMTIAMAGRGRTRASSPAEANLKFIWTWSPT